MAIHIALHHKTHYKYDRVVGHGPHVIRLRPAPHCRTRILSFAQRISGGEHFTNWQQDPFSNWNARLVFSEPMRELIVEVELIAEMAVYNPFDFFIDESASNFPFTYEPTLKKDLAPFLEAGPLSPVMEANLAEVRRELALGVADPVATIGNGSKSQPQPKPEVGSPDATAPAAATATAKSLRTIDFLVAINQRLQRQIKYLIRLEPGVQTPEETLTKLSGSCRDSAWLSVQLLRHFGLATRFVSGYLIQLAPDVKSLDGPSGTEKDFTDLHAWCEVYLPGAGWIGFDSTSGLLAGEGHIPLSCTPEPGTAAPVSGAVDKCESTLHHEMRIERIYESPRVTKPYTEETWSRIEALGGAIDTDLAKQDVRLTMGGEPTFISIDDPDGPEWNFTAVSHKKRVLSGQLIKRLRSKFAPGALLHYGQGKWYPGEQLPRWALAAYWRKDGLPLWKNEALIADEAKDYGFGTKEALTLATHIAQVLGVDARFLLPAYEDSFYHLWKERRLPSNVDAEKSNLKDKAERDRLARIFQQGLGEVVGYALPLRRNPLTRVSPSWESGAWFLRDDATIWLLPGDSPMGLRLPLDSLPWVAPKDHPTIPPPDPTEKLPALAPKILDPRLSLSARSAAALPAGIPAKVPSATPAVPGNATPIAPEAPGADHRPGPGESASWIIRTALCVEPRGGRLHIFMPPTAGTEDYLELLAAIETAVTQVGLPVIIEGEAPPRDSRLNKLAVTPDPGVIEVNLHPSASWQDLVERTTVLYEEARQTRLGTEKFMMDGRHTGTGGGNHIIIGGETPGDAPVLRRPDLLRSLLAYWQNHPSLSSLFSGLFIGPTSQAPRVDEARNDSLHELEIAFRELDRNIRADGSALPWLVDRLFRHLLIDASGNTHRAEFSIDKLYSPDSAAGRLGLVEMRAYEMPPHARMSLAQHLLLRGLIAKFWREPYRGELVRWGTEIHDRWMLPHFCAADFRDVMSDLREAGYPFEFEWFAPHFEFRFPRIGDFVQRNVEVELRTALEPWHVLGEQDGGGGTVRYVDSSLERLQVKIRGLTDNRFVVTANGHAVPLHPTGVNGEAVGGVRFRAWQPPECLHPTIGVHVPLTFNLYDRWNQRSLGGCTYHVAHPGGLNYVTLPINAYEAESRRLSRFALQAWPQGRPITQEAQANPDYPYTLDLRRV